MMLIVCAASLIFESRYSNSEVLSSRLLKRCPIRLWNPGTIDSVNQLVKTSPSVLRLESATRSSSSFQALVSGSGRNIPPKSGS